MGGALRNNPFAPRIPCHRVIASSFFVGGFKGEWTAPVRRRSAGGGDGSGESRRAAADGIGEWGGKTKNWNEPFRVGGMGPLQDAKVRMLVQEGVDFGKDGKLLVSQGAMWKFDWGLDAEE